MRHWMRVSAGIILVALAAGLCVFLVRQGLGKASLWASILGLPLAAIIAVAGVWAAVLAARSMRGSHLQRETPEATGLSLDARPGVSGTGTIRQRETRGTTVAHTGSGDINVNAARSEQQQDEPR